MNVRVYTWEMSFAPLSAVALGTQYERAVLALLHALGARVAGTGGSGDRGVDFVGTWRFTHEHGGFALPPAPLPPHRVRLLLASAESGAALPVAGQCKATSSRVGTAVMRDFQAALASSAPSCVGILACTAGFALGELASQPGLVARHTLLLHVSLGGALLDARVQVARRGEAAGLPPPPLSVRRTAPVG